MDGVPGREVGARVRLYTESRLGSCLVARMVEGEVGGGWVSVVVPDRPNAKYER